MTPRWQAVREAMRSILPVLILAFGVAAAEDSPPASSSASAAAPPGEVGKPLPCPKSWVWEQSRLAFPETPGPVFDYSSFSEKGAQDFAEQLEKGGISLSPLARAMERGSETPATVTIAAPYPILVRILWLLDTRDLKIKRMPLLNVHIISDPGREQQLERFLATYQAHVAFTKLDLPPCATAP